MVGLASLFGGLVGFGVWLSLLPNFRFLVLAIWVRCLLQALAAMLGFDWVAFSGNAVKPLASWGGRLRFGGRVGFSFAGSAPFWQRSQLLCIIHVAFG